MRIGASFNQTVKHGARILNFVVQQHAVSPLDACFAALADPTRRAVIERLAAGEATLGELAEPLPMSLAAVQKHVRVLEDAGLVQTQKRGRSRHVRLAATPMREATRWMQRYRDFWEPRLDKLAELLEQEHDEGNHA